MFRGLFQPKRNNDDDELMKLFGALLLSDQIRRKVNEHLDYKGTRPLMVTAKKGDIKECADLIEFGADVNLVDADGDSALIWAILGSQRRVANFLMAKGAYVSR